MLLVFTKSPILIVALCVLSVGPVAAQPSDAGAKQAAASAAKEKARKAAPAAGDIQKFVDQLKAQRDALIAEHESLAKQLKGASAEQIKEIKEKIAQRKKDFENAQNALHKQIRDEQRRQRQNAGRKN